MLNLYDLEHVDKSWRIAYIPKKSGGKRKLTIPNDALKDVQRDILEYLYQLRDQGRLNVSGVAHGFLPYRSTLTSLLRHDKKSEIFVCCDIHHAFDELKPIYVSAPMIDGGVSEEYAKAMIDACSYNGSLPQGAPTSPFMLNIAMFEADCQIAAYAKKHGFTYTRYADDLTFSVRECDPKVLDALRKNEAKDSPSKNPFLWFLYGVDKILQMTVDLHLNHKKDHVIFRGSKCKPYILGVCVRQDGEGYNAERRFRENTRAGICNLYHRVFDGREKPTTYDDWLEWKTLEGRVRYADLCRSRSNPGFDFCDPVIQEKFYEPLQRKFNAADRIFGTAQTGAQG